MLDIKWIRNNTEEFDKLLLKRGISSVSSDILQCDEERLGGQAGCHMYWALGSRRSLFGWFVVCSVGASRRCYFESRAAVLPPPLVLLDNAWQGSIDRRVM